MMFSQGLMLAAYHESGGSASMHALIYCLGGSETLASIILMITFPFSTLGIRWRWLLMPQLMISLIYAAGAVSVIFIGAYADSYVPTGGRPFIYNDQIAYVSLLLIHAFAVGYQLL